MVEACEHRTLEFPLVGKTRLEASAKARSRVDFLSSSGMKGGSRSSTPTSWPASQ